MDIAAYRKALHDYVKEAMENTDGSNQEVAGYLWEKRVSGWFTPNKTEKQRALDDARKAFDDHRHWPVEIILSHLGVELNKPE